MDLRLKSPDDFVTDPTTGKKIRKGGIVYSRLVKSGKIIEEPSMKETIQESKERKSRGRKPRESRKSIPLKRNINSDFIDLLSFIPEHLIDEIFLQIDPVKHFMLKEISENANQRYSNSSFFDQYVSINSKIVETQEPSWMMGASTFYTPYFGSMKHGDEITYFQKSDYKPSLADITRIYSGGKEHIPLSKSIQHVIPYRFGKKEGFEITYARPTPEEEADRITEDPWIVKEWHDDQQHGETIQYYHRTQKQKENNMSRAIYTITPYIHGKIQGDEIRYSEPTNERLIQGLPGSIDHFAHFENDEIEGDVFEYYETTKEEDSEGKSGPLMKITPYHAGKINGKIISYLRPTSERRKKGLPGSIDKITSYLNGKHHGEEISFYFPTRQEEELGLSGPIEWITKWKFDDIVSHKKLPYKVVTPVD